jgi:enoyl-CoA hydratase/carnithine racemase
MADYSSFKDFRCTFPAEGVLKLELNKPKGNTLDQPFFDNFPLLLDVIDNDPDVRVVVLCGSGKHFTFGLDLKSMGSVLSGEGATKDTARKAIAFLKTVKSMQGVTDKMASLRVPVIALVHGACIGGGIDLITAADIRWASTDVKLSIKEVDIGIVADIGTMARTTKIIGNESLFREYAFSGDMFGSSEAKAMGLVSRVFDDKKSMESDALAYASKLAKKSPVALNGIKHIGNYSMDHTTSESQDYVGLWNASMLQTKDVFEAVSAFFTKREPKFSKL